LSGSTGGRQSATSGVASRKRGQIDVRQAQSRKQGSGNLLLPASSWQDASATLMMGLADVILASSASPRQGRKR